jgi:DNA-binding beta-propeller fold protein YncE
VFYGRVAWAHGVVFVPPHDRYLAACNLELGTITFFRITSLSPLEIQNQPELEWKHESIYHPDGLAFSNCGKWLAVANHGKQTVTIFQRRDGYLAGKKVSFYPEPVTIIKDPRLRYPHSVAFTPTTNHVIVTNAGANYFGAYAPKRRWFCTQWSQVPESQVVVHDDDSFQEVNMANKMEGGPKGVATNKNTLAVCSPQIGVKIYSFHE